MLYLLRPRWPRRQRWHLTDEQQLLETAADRRGGSVAAALAASLTEAAEKGTRTRAEERYLTISVIITRLHREAELLEQDHPLLRMGTVS